MRFSRTEIEHLIKAWLAISLAFAILSNRSFDPTFLIYFVISLLTVGIAFLLHEIAHKYVAQRYNCWAEFRADERMLVFAIISSFMGFVFAAPGAVLIRGHVTVEKNGRISLAGPLTNIALALFFLVLGLLPLPSLMGQAVYYGLWINSFIALFNMVPFGNFDGAKVLRWNKKIYAVTVVAAVILTFTS